MVIALALVEAGNRVGLGGYCQKPLFGKVRLAVRFLLQHFSKGQIESEQGVQNTPFIEFEEIATTADRSIVDENPRNSLL
jgi:hypothetical protein